jgi:hypothetical protein
MCTVRPGLALCTALRGGSCTRLARGNVLLPQGTFYELALFTEHAATVLLGIDAHFDEQFYAKSRCHVSACLVAQCWCLPQL